MKIIAHMLPVAAVLGALLVGGCDEYIEADNLAYIERMVVSGVLEAGTDTARVLIARTLPLTELYAFDRAALRDVRATITGNGMTHVLVEQKPGVYVAPLSIQSGNVYDFQAEWNGMHVHASTLVPATVIPDTVRYFQDTLYYYFTPENVFYVPIFVWRVEAIFLPRPHEVYELATTAGYSWLSSGVVRPEAARGDGKLALSTIAPGSEQQGSIVNATILAFDEPYYDYAASLPGGTQSDDLVFSFAGASVKWNVKGDGIGMFIGRAATTRAVPF